ncbi:hypothetical protein [Pseudoduganella chitinolytica]|uniref:Uncharacterized protein n=1 Tax=Pseudoduganella chitinolytica TaxID=34070 RepID=A0ABY8BL45_9BURK|nr:hypothetical protein [Pseudoduganella chitinolytica]WEF35089.1 hypothetical protein PX653_10100 [Pseudoduganella chitinolytica]
MLKSILGTALLLGGLTGGIADAAELVVIVSARTAVTALRHDQVAGIFMAEASSFPDGARPWPWTRASVRRCATSSTRRSRTVRPP